MLYHSAMAMVEIVLEKMGQLIWEETCQVLIQGVEIERLSSELKQMQWILQSLKQQQLCDWVWGYDDDLQELVYEVDDLVDELIFDGLDLELQSRCKKKVTGSVKDWFSGIPESLLTNLKLLSRRYRIARGVTTLSERIRLVNYGLQAYEQRNKVKALSFSLPQGQQGVASKVKKALGLKSRRKNLGSDPVEVQGQEPNTESQRKRSSTVGELMRVRMKVSEQTDSRVRRGLLRVAAGKLGRRIESMVLPLELLQQFKSSDFPSQLEYETWQKRNLKILEAGLLLHPHLPLDKTDSSAQQLRQVIRGAYETPLETGKHSQPVQVLRNVVMSLACRSFDGSGSMICHWADGIPLNLHLYRILLEACFDVNDETTVIEEVDEVVELIKKTWVILGINQNLHNLCFAWVLFYQYIATGQVANDLLFATDSLLLEVEKDAKVTKDPAHWRMLSSTLSSILGWAEKRLLAYYDNFYRGNIDIMENVLSLGISVSKILVEDGSQGKHSEWKEVDVACGRIDSYIRSSLQHAFSQEKEKIISSRQTSKNQQDALHMLSTLAQNITDLAFTEKEIFSPILKQWHPLATAVAAATLHACYRNELKQYVSGVTELTPDAVQVLIASDKLEKDLVQMAVADSVDSDDGGKAIIQEMTPYEADTVIVNLVKSWIKTRVDRLEEWVERNLQQEVWNPRANKERFAPSAVEVLRIIDETLDAFFLLPIAMHQVLIPDLMNGLDYCLQNYILKTKSGSGSKGTFLPSLPALTRCTADSKFGVFKKKDRSYMVQVRKSQVGTDVDNSFDIPKLCVRINTMHLIRKELEVMEKRITSDLTTNGYVQDYIVSTGSGKMFELSAAACVEGIQQLSEATAYRIIFHDLNHVLWDYLYVGEVLSSRIEPFLQELEQNLEIVSATVHDRVRTRVITQIMRASFDGFLLVLLGGGPSRTFTLQDAAVLDEDFKFLMDLFWSNGDGLPTDLISKYSTTIRDVLPLFHTDTVNLVEQFKLVTLDRYGASDISKLPLPPTPGQWSPTEPNTILRVLCHRNDHIATKFLKKTYHFPKKL